MSADKLAEALRNELLRRKVTGLPSKVRLLEQLGLTSFEEVNVWMVKAADDFEAAANEYLEQHEAEKQEPDRLDAERYQFAMKSMDFAICQWDHCNGDWEHITDNENIDSHMHAAKEAKP